MKFVVLGLCAVVMSAFMTLQNDEAIESAMSAGPRFHHRGSNRQGLEHENASRRQQ